MSIRTVLFLIPGALMLAPATGFAQSVAAPPEVEQALRARVTEFFQDFEEGKFRQALSLVAEDTQDEYFSSSKAEIRNFKIDTIAYSDNFTKAEVNLAVHQVVKAKAEGFMQDFEMDRPMPTSWKIESGKWVYYHVPEANLMTPMGPGAPRNPTMNGAGTIPKKLDEATLTSEADRVLHQTKLDRDQVTLATDKPSSAKVVFHNGAQGSVSIDLIGLPKVLPGFSAHLDKQDVGAGQDAILDIQFDPAAQQGPPFPFEIGVEVTPFNQLYRVTVNFGAPAK